MKKSIGINAVLNIIKQLCAIIFSLITFPYISRTLGAEYYGKVNFSSTFVSYFSLLAALGITNYAIREGARIRTDKQKFQRFVEQVFTINVISTIISYILLFSIVVFWDRLHSYWCIIAIHSLTIILTTVGTDWVNSIYEDYFYITVRYIVIQIVSIAVMFLFVRSMDDYLIYAGISVVSSAGANLLNIIHVRKYVRVRITRHPNIRNHIIPMLTLFCNSLSVQIYVNSDITMLGILQNDVAVGIYSAATKIYNIIKQLLNAIIVVTLPRISALLGEEKRDAYNALLDRVFHSIASAVLPAITGIFMLSYEIIYIIGGQEYADGYWALRILSVALAGAIFANFFNNAILVPNKKEKYFLRATLTAAAANIAINIILIPSIGYNGAALTTVIAEFIVFAFGLHFSRGLYAFKINKRDIVSCAVGCFAIIVICLVVKSFVNNLISRTVISVVASVIIYAIILLLFRNRLAVSALELIKEKTNRH